MEVNQPYVNKTLQDPAKVESNEVGKLIDEIASQVKDPNIRNSLISQSAKYKFKATNGLANRTYADTKPGIFKRVGSTIKGIFNRSKNKPQQNAVAQQNQNNANQQGNGNQTQQNNQTNIAPNSNANQNQQPQQNAVAQQNQNNANQQVKQPQPTLVDAINEKMNNSSMVGLGYVTSTGLDRLANSNARKVNLAGDIHQDTYNKLAVDTTKLKGDISKAKRKGETDKANELQKQLDTRRQFNNDVSNSIQDDLYDGNTLNTIQNDLNNYYHYNNKSDVEKDQMYKRSDDYFANQLKALSNKRMINLDNIRFFSENTQEFVVKMYADSLTEEEMQSALKRKKLKNKVLNILKTIGKVGLAGAALYGGAKWLKNGGKDYVDKLMDKSSDFVSKTGDAAIETAKGIKDDSKDEWDRSTRELAKWRLSQDDDKVDGSKFTDSDESKGLTDDDQYYEINKGLDALDNAIEVKKAEANATMGYGGAVGKDHEKYVNELNDLLEKKGEQVYRAGELALKRK